MAIEIVDFPIKNGGSFHSKMVNSMKHIFSCASSDFKAPNAGEAQPAAVKLTADAAKPRPTGLKMRKL